MSNFIGMGGSEYMVSTSAAYQALKGIDPKAAQLLSVAKQLDKLSNVDTLASTLEQNAISFANQFRGRPMTDEDKAKAKELSNKATAAKSEATKAKAEAARLQGQFVSLNKAVTQGYQVYEKNKAIEDAKKSEEEKRKAQQAAAAAQAANARAQATAQANTQNQASQAVNNINDAVVFICERPPANGVIDQANLEMCTGYPLPYSQQPDSNLRGKPLGLPPSGGRSATTTGEAVSVSGQDIRLANMGSSPEIVKETKKTAAAIKAKSTPVTKPAPKAIPPKAPPKPAARPAPARTAPPKPAQSVVRRTNPGR